MLNLGAQTDRPKSIKTGSKMSPKTSPKWPPGGPRTKKVDHWKTLKNIKFLQCFSKSQASLGIPKSNKKLRNSVAASDAFFPFPDGVKNLIKAGVKVIVQPGGSIRDQEVIESANKAKIKMLFTGIIFLKK